MVTGSTAESVPKKSARVRHKRNPEWIYSVLILIGLVACWQVAVWATGVSPLLLPPPSGVASTFAGMVADGSLPKAAWHTFEILLESVALGVCISTILAAIGVFTSVGGRIIRTLASMLNPLPGVAVLPLCIIWLGFGRWTVIVVVLNTIVWVMALNLLTGFQTTPATLRRVGQSLELSKLRMLTDLYLPAAIPTALTGFRLAWAYGWRTIVAVELVIGGGTGSQIGLGALIDRARYNFETKKLFSSLVAIILIGFAIEQFTRMVEKRTAVRWGMMEQH